MIPRSYRLTCKTHEAITADVPVACEFSGGFVGINAMKTSPMIVKLIDWKVVNHV